MKQKWYRYGTVLQIMIARYWELPGQCKKKGKTDILAD